MASKKKNRRDVPLTVQGFALFVDRVVRPFLKGLQKESSTVRREIEAMHRKVKELHREYRMISEQTRQIELRIHGATQQAILVMKYQLSTLQKRIESLEGD